MSFLKKLFPRINVNKNERLIAEYWQKDRERKRFEKQFATYPTAHYTFESEKLKEELEKIGATDLMLTSEGYEAPKIMFKLGEKEIISDQIFDFTCDKIMENIRTKI